LLDSEVEEVFDRMTRLVVKLPVTTPSNLLLRS
jgi:hypothetical protein